MNLTYLQLFEDIVKYITDIFKSFENYLQI